MRNGRSPLTIFKIRPVASQKTRSVRAKCVLMRSSASGATRIKGSSPPRSARSRNPGFRVSSSSASGTNKRRPLPSGLGQPAADPQAEITERTAREVDDAGKLLWISDSKTKAGRRRVEVPEPLQPYLLRLKSERQPTALLFGQHWRDWPRKWVQRICVEAGVPRVTAHGMRGLHATLALQAGIASHAVAQTLGHESPSVTIRSYAEPGSADIVPARRAVSTLMPN